jgi:hypothetical protein
LPVDVELPTAIPPSAYRLLRSPEADADPEVDPDIVADAKTAPLTSEPPEAELLVDPMPEASALVAALELVVAVTLPRAKRAAVALAVELLEDDICAVASMSPATLEVPELFAVKSPSP